MWKLVYKIVVVAILLGLIIFVLSIAPNYKKSEAEGKIQWIINNSDVTLSTKKDTYRDTKGNFYVAMEDIANFFDAYIYLETSKNSIVTTGEEKVAVLPVGETRIEVNGKTKSVQAPIEQKDGTYYIPLNILEDIYDITVEYKESTDTIVVESMDREAIGARTNQKSTIHFKPTIFSKAVDKLEENSQVTVVEDVKGWTKVRTENGKIGYIATDALGNQVTLRQAKAPLAPVQGNISMAWDYFSEFVTAPNRTGTTIDGINVISPTFAILKEQGEGELEINIGREGRAYMDWANSNGYAVWPMISNNSFIDTTSSIMRDPEARTRLVENIVDLVEEYQWTGINIDFEYMYAADKELFNRFLIELAPRLHEKGAVLSVDVTAPDGSENWSLCFDRHAIGNIADYVVFMAYDQHGSGDGAGTNAGYNWVETNLQKFIQREEVDPQKIILGIPFYTRVWKQDVDSKDTSVISIKNLDNYIPEGVERKWQEDLQQYYVEYEQDGTTYKIWLEEERSIGAKLDLAKKYQLAGAAYWTKDREMASIWNIIQEKLNI